MSTTTRDLVSIGQYSDRGVKTENQDSYGVLVPESPLLESKGIVAVMADGVSGSEAGRIASETTVKSLLHDYACTAESWTVKTSVEKVLQATNRWLCGQGGGSLRRSCATTLSALVVKSTTAHLFHVGDTRIYRLRGSELTQLTQDHRIWLSEEKNFLTRALGIDLHLDIDYRHFPVEVGDTFIFTTDGVHEYVSEQALINQVLTHAAHLDRAAREIATAALRAGSPDNVSCQMVRFDHLPQLDARAWLDRLTEKPFPPDLEPGMRLDGYRIVRGLHASARSQVYLAVDEESGASVVIKTPSVNYQDDAIYLDLFSHEEWVGKRLHSPHVLQMIEPVRPRQFLYSVSEYVDGQTLRHWMHEHPQADLQLVRDLVGQIARGLMAFHRLEMIHQDLKPENLIIDRQGTVKIIDFGSTKIAGVEEIATPIHRLTLLGTRHYTAPEYLLGEPCSARSDLFSLAVITYELLTGHLPFGERYDETTIRRLQYTSARQWAPDLPLWVDWALEKALRRNPVQRQEELSEFLHDLAEPNPAFLSARRLPLLTRAPVDTWRALFIASLLVNLVLLFLLSRV